MTCIVLNTQTNQTDLWTSNDVARVFNDYTEPVLDIEPVDSNDVNEGMMFSHNSVLHEVVEVLN